MSLLFTFCHFFPLSLSIHLPPSLPLCHTPSFSLCGQSLTIMSPATYPAPPQPPSSTSFLPTSLYYLSISLPPSLSVILLSYPSAANLSPQCFRQHSPPLPNPTPPPSPYSGPFLPTSLSLSIYLSNYPSLTPHIRPSNGAINTANYCSAISVTRNYSTSRYRIVCYSNNNNNNINKISDVESFRDLLRRIPWKY